METCPYCGSANTVQTVIPCAEEEREIIVCADCGEPVDHWSFWNSLIDLAKSLSDSYEKLSSLSSDQVQE